MKNLSLLLISIMLVFTSCKNQKEESEEKVTTQKNKLKNHQ